jgi:hypothetical protein
MLGPRLLRPMLGLCWGGLLLGPILWSYMCRDHPAVME